MKGPQVERRQSFILKSDLTVNELCIKLMLVFVNWIPRWAPYHRMVPSFVSGPQLKGFSAGDSPAGYVSYTVICKASMGRLGGI